MLFGKKKNQTPADVFFNGMEQYLKKIIKAIDERDNTSEIDKEIKQLSKNFTQKEVFQGLLYGEEWAILEMIYHTMLILNTDEITMPKETYDILLDNTGLLHDRALKFTKVMLDLLPFNENKKIGFREVEIIGYREMYKVEIKRIDYIKKLAAQKGFTEKDLEMPQSLFLFDKTFKDAVIKKPEYDKGEMIIGILKAFPEGTFNRKGLAPLY